MNFVITGISEPQLDKNGNNHIRLYSEDEWTMSDNGTVTLTKGETEFCYKEEMFDSFQIGQTINIR